MAKQSEGFSNGMSEYYNNLTPEQIDASKDLSAKIAEFINEDGLKAFKGRIGGVKCEVYYGDDTEGKTVVVDVEGRKTYIPYYNFEDALTLTAPVENLRYQMKK